MRELRKYYRAESKFDSNYTICERKMYSQGNWFLTKTDAEADFLTAFKIAEEKYNQLLNELSRIREDMALDFHFDYYMKGDTYGIYEDGCYIQFSINGYAFKFLQ